MTDWTELPDFPRTFASRCAPWGSVARVVRGVAATAGGKPVTLSGTRAFLQRLEGALIDGYAARRDVAAVVAEVLEAHARHIDSAEWCRVRGDELDLSLRVYAARGSQRLHLALSGPLGRYADEPLPERAAPAKPKAPRKAATKAAVATPVVAAPTLPRLPPPAELRLLRPVVAGARPSYSDPIAHDQSGRVHLALRLPDGDAFAALDPDGAVTVTPLTSREALREADGGAMTGAILPHVHASAVGVIFVDHYQNTSGEQERIGHGGRWHAGRRGLYSGSWVLGVFAGWFLRCITNGKKATLIGIHLGTGKRARVALPDGIELGGAAVDSAGEGLLLRVLDGASEERRFHLEVGAKVAITPTEGLTHGLDGALQQVGDLGAWTVVDETNGRCGLRLVRADRSRVDLFTLPADFTAAGYQAWGLPRVTQVGFGAQPRWLCQIDIGADKAPRCTGALVFAGDGRVLGSAHRDALGRLKINDAVIDLAEGEHVCGFSAGVDGDMAAALALGDGLGLVWAPPLA